MNDHDRTADLDAMDMNDDNPADNKPTGEGVPIPTQIRDAVNGIKQRAKEEFSQDRDVVKEYEDRYHGSRESRKNRLEAPDEAPVVDEVEGTPVRVARYAKPKRGYEPDDNERKWAALAHGSTLLTALVALGSGGAGALITIFVPLLIYFAFRKRSDFVAFHALQAFTIQLVGTVGWLALFITGTIVWVGLLILSALLILVLVGIILLPLVALLFPIFLLASLALPVGMVIYSVIATIETWNGHDYRYPYIARWVESQMTPVS